MTIVAAAPMSAKFRHTLEPTMAYAIVKPAEINSTAAIKVSCPSCTALPPLWLRLKSAADPNTYRTPRAAARPRSGSSSGEELRR
jgi:hypothetical protein